MLILAYIYIPHWFWKGRKSMNLYCDEKDIQSVSIHNHLGWHKVAAFTTPGNFCLKWPGWTANLVNGAVNHAHGVGEVWKCVQELAPLLYRVSFYIILIIHKKIRHNMVNLFCHGAFRNTEICARTYNFKYWQSQIITSRTWLCTLRMQGHLLFARSVCGRCLGAVTSKYMFSTMFSKDSGISPVKYQNMIGFSSKFCHTSLPLDLLPWKFGNNTLMSFLALLFLREWQLGEELRQKYWS